MLSAFFAETLGKNEFGTTTTATTATTTATTAPIVTIFKNA